MTIKLTGSQQEAFLKVIFFIENKVETCLTIVGSAGVGKTTLTKYIANYMCDAHLAFCAIAPTHKAKHILDYSLNSQRFSPVPIYTIASLLCKIREHSYIGTKKFSNADVGKLMKYRYFIIDEVSMVADEDLTYIIKYATDNRSKIIMMGDNFQLPCPSQKLIKNKENELIKSDSLAFKSCNVVRLTEIVRQAQGSPIINLATFVRSKIGESFDFSQLPILDNMKLSLSELGKFKELWLSTKLLCYTNAKVGEYNKLIREIGRAHV